jgi:hypothetical protein
VKNNHLDLKRFHTAILAAALAMALNPAPHAAADQMTASAEIPINDQSAEPKIDEEAPIEVNSGSDQHLPKVKTFVDLDIPHQLNSSAVCTCYAYPYPMQPPRKRYKLPPLALNTHAIKKQIEMTAYVKRNVRAEYYPNGGYRWQYAYHTALKETGKMEPHLVTNLYLFSRSLTPLVREECEKRNNFEEQREKRYNAAVKDFKEERADAETDATREGRTPTFVKFSGFGPHGVRRAIVGLGPGQWWIVATLKIPGLTYYWQQPLTVHPGDTEHTVLDEDSALFIEGAW